METITNEPLCDSLDWDRECLQADIDCCHPIYTQQAKKLREKLKASNIKQKNWPAEAHEQCGWDDPNNYKNPNNWPLRDKNKANILFELGHPVLDKNENPIKFEL